MEKLNVVIMGQNCEKFIGMCLESVKDADNIIYCDGGSEDETTNIIGEAIRDRDGDIIYNEYDQEDKAMNGKQRNFYLDYLKKYHMGEWALCLDADEVVEDLSKIKEYINNDFTAGGVHSVKMRHLIGDLGHEDATAETHFVLNRLFHITEELSYPEVEHPVLQGLNGGTTDCTTIWHLAYCPNMWDIKKRYDCHMAKSNIHSPEYLAQWYKAHLFGVYPKSPFNPVELPDVILDEFGIDKDELYFAGREQMELKHYLDSDHWNRFFRPKRVLMYGCGFGQRVNAMNQMGVDARGIELSKYAVDNALSAFVKQGSILKNFEDDCDLVVAYDILEHLKYEDLGQAINNLKRTKRWILVSVPFKGTPNCENDPTHIIKEDREWWVKQFTDKKLKEVKVPGNFLYRDQILIFEK